MRLSRLVRDLNSFLLVGSLIACLKTDPRANFNNDGWQDVLILRGDSVEIVYGGSGVRQELGEFPEIQYIETEDCNQDGSPDVKVVLPDCEVLFYNTGVDEYKVQFESETLLY